MNKKTITVLTIIIVFIILSIYVYHVFVSGKNSSKQTAKNTSTKIAHIELKIPYLLEEYPLQTVPLYKLKSIGSSKYFVNIDPSRSEDYFGKKVNYYNVVYKSDSKAPETLAYYAGLMTEKNTKGVSDTQVQGVVGKYKVSVSQYEGEDVYVEVYMPANEVSETNPYYTSYPVVVDLLADNSAYEMSYGYLNQKGGEIEYTQYYPLPTEEKDIDELILQYEERYKTETQFNYDEKTGMMKWEKNGFQITLTFSKNHGRIYLMMRRPKE